MNAQQMVEAAANWMDERKPGWERGLLPEDWINDDQPDAVWETVERFWVDEIKARFNR